MERIVVNRSATLYKTFYVDGVATDPTGTPTVVVTRSDSSTVATGAVTNETAAGTWSASIAATANTLLDTLTVRWTGTVGGVAQQYVDTVEVAGDVLFTLADARALTPLDNATKYPDAAVLDMRTLVEQALEDACGIAFVPRYELETFNGEGLSTLLPKWPRVRAVRSASINGTALDVTQLATVVPSSGGLYYSTGWTAGFSNVVIGYEHGYTSPPARVSRAALRLAKRWLVEGPIDDRATSLSNDDGTFALVTPGLRGAVFDLPEVNAVVEQYGGFNLGVA